MQGKLEFIQGNYAEALTYLNLAGNQYFDGNIEVLLLAADCCRRLGQQTAATTRLAKAARLQPGNTNLRLQLIEMLIQDRQFREEEAHLQELLEAESPDPRAVMMQAGLLAVTGDQEKAIELYQQMDPQENPQLIRPLTLLLVQEDRKDEALAILRQRVEVEATDATAVQLLYVLTEDEAAREKILATAREAGIEAATLERLKMAASGEGPAQPDLSAIVAEESDEFKKALGEAQLKLNEDRTADIKPLLERAMSLADTVEEKRTATEIYFAWAVEKQNFETAADIIKTVAAENLDLTSGAYYRGRLHLAKGETDEAVRELRDAVSRRSVFDEAHRYLGQALFRLGDYDAAINAYETALSQRRSNIAALRGLAAVHDRRGEHLLALDRIKQALSYQGRNIELINLYLNYEQKHGDKQTALELREQVAEKSPKDLANRRLLAQLYAELDRMEDAFMTINSAIEDGGATRESVAVLAQLQRLAGKPGEALQTVRSFVNERGVNATTQDYQLLAEVAAAVGQTDLAIQAYQRATTNQDLTTMPASRALARFLTRTGDFDRAIQIWQDVVEKNAQDPEARAALADLHMGQKDYDAAA
ncbi:MAG: tetratricopeptide repeat protein, partial [Rhodospirillales bacterium]|nr:tetratricopeptide repeat protein [Rhodospirillales bacterium]